MGIISWIILGALAGVIAKAIMKSGPEPSGWIATIILGIVGALIGGWIASAIFNVNVNENFWNLGTWAFAILGSCLALWIYGMFKTRNNKTNA